MLARRSRRRAWSAALALLAACGSACGKPAAVRPPERGPRRAPAGAVAVATLNGEAITADDVVATARAEGLADPRAALERAIAVRLLAAEAARRGLDRDPLAVDTERRGLIQALLARAVEATVRPDALPADEIAAGLRLRGFELRHGELRLTEHVVLRLPPDADAATRARARADAETLRQRVALALAAPGAPPLADLADAALPGVPRCGNERTVAHACRRTETLPPVDREGRHARGALVPAYAAATSALAHEGDVAPVTETEFGYHVIVLRAIRPAVERSDADVRATIVDELLWRRRAVALDGLLATLRGRYHADVREPALRAVDHARIDFGSAP